MLVIAKPSRNAVVIGGGLLGLEAANGLLSRGMAVTVGHLFETLMERQLDAAAAALLRAPLSSRGNAFREAPPTSASFGHTTGAGVCVVGGSSIPPPLRR